MIRRAGLPEGDLTRRHRPAGAQELFARAPGRARCRRARPASFAALRPGGASPATLRRRPLRAAAAAPAADRERPAHAPADDRRASRRLRRRCALVETPPAASLGRRRRTSSASRDIRSPASPALPASPRSPTRVASPTVVPTAPAISIRQRVPARAGPRARRRSAGGIFDPLSIKRDFPDPRRSASTDAGSSGSTTPPPRRSRARSSIASRTSTSTRTPTSIAPRTRWRPAPPTPTRRARDKVARFLNAPSAEEHRLRPRRDRGDQPRRPELGPAQRRRRRRDRHHLARAPRQHRPLAAALRRDGRAPARGAGRRSRAGHPRGVREAARPADAARLVLAGLERARHHRPGARRWSPWPIATARACLSTARRPSRTCRSTSRRSTATSTASRATRSSRRPASARCSARATSSRRCPPGKAAGT